MIISYSEKTRSQTPHSLEASHRRDPRMAGAGYLVDCRRKRPETLVGKMTNAFILFIMMLLTLGCSAPSSGKVNFQYTTNKNTVIVPIKSDYQRLTIIMEWPSQNIDPSNIFVSAKIKPGSGLIFAYIRPLKNDNSTSESTLNKGFSFETEDEIEIFSGKYSDLITTKLLLGGQSSIHCTLTVQFLGDHVPNTNGLKVYGLWFSNYL